MIIIVKCPTDTYKRSPFIRAPIFQSYDTFYTQSFIKQKPSIQTPFVETPYVPGL